MKKIIASIVVMALAVVMLSCGSVEKELLGKWKIEVSVMGLAEEHETQYLEIVFTEDGTGYGKMPFEAQVDFAYALDGEVMIFAYVDRDGTKVEKTVPFALEDTTLTFFSDRADVVLSKT